MSLKTMLYSMPGHLLRRGHQISVAVSTEELSEFGVTPMQYISLVGIHENAGLDITALSGLIAVDRATLGGVLDRLEEKGYILRKAVKSDRRFRQLHITAEGEALVAAASNAVARAQERILEPLSANERVQLTRLLTKLVRLQAANMPASVKSVLDRAAG